ncbi:Flp family type IVb pilin [Pleomorphomonas koreensis]|uniref:Flp family type IVb pilin n=1 Tax=Pleomorphomonas koreensis TaxID=257440 RepID=UPI00041F5D22|nr:Flp family type IVb pilin [Pleomorphomonas koreensis]
MAEKRPKPRLCRLGAFLRDLRGATAIEYGILMMMVGLALLGMVSLTDVSNRINDTFAYISNTLSQ